MQSALPTAAAELLGVSQPSVSTQIKQLEESIGHRLFDRSGRTMTLTAEGKVVLEYADEIFRLGRELEETVRGRLMPAPMRSCARGASPGFQGRRHGPVSVRTGTVRLRA